MTPLVSVIVLNYRSPRDVVRCVQALEKQTIKEQLEIIAIDNHSDDESIALLRAQLRKFPNVRILEQRENMGYGSGNNTAATYATGEFLLILNPDNMLPPDALETMIAYMESHPDAGITGPALVYPDGSLRPSARSFPTPWDLLTKRLFSERWHAKFHQKQKKDASAIEVDWLVGACLLLRKELFHKLGGFDERFFLFFEDIDLCRRIKALGKKVVYLPGVHIQDRKGRLSGSSIFSLVTRKTTRIHLASAVKYFWKWK